MQSETGERRRQHGLQVPGQVVLPAVEQVLEVQPGLGFALDGEAALEEQRVGIFLAARERDEVRERPADRHMRRAARAPEAATVHLEVERQRHILDAQAETLALQFIEPAREQLAAQQMVDRERERARLQGCRRKAQHAVNDGHGIGQHGGLATGRGRHSCHERARGGLITINAPDSGAARPGGAAR